MKKKSILTVSLVVCICSVILLCLFISTNSLSAMTAEIKSEVDDMAKKISKNDASPTLSSAYPSPATHSEEFFNAYKLGYEAAPYILDYIIKNDVNGFVGAFLISAAVNNLHLNKMPGAIEINDTDTVYSTEPDAYTPVWYAKQLQRFAKEAPEKVDEICNSNITMSEKMLKLEEYGMLAVPILQNKIKSGETQWNQCVLILSLSELTVQERYDVLSYKYEDEVLYSRNQNNLIHQKILDATSDKNFNEQWFIENDKKLTLISKMYD